MCLEFYLIDASIVINQSILSNLPNIVNNLDVKLDVESKYVKTEDNQPFIKQEIVQDNDEEHLGKLGLVYFTSVFFFVNFFWRRNFT